MLSVPDIPKIISILYIILKFIFCAGIVVSAFALPVVLHRAPGVPSAGPNNSTQPDLPDEGIVSIIYFSKNWRMAFQEFLYLFGFLLFL